MTTYPERAPIEKFLIFNFLDIIELIGDEHDRVKFLLTNIRGAIDSGDIKNNIIVGTDNQDTNWIFEIKKIEEEIYYLEFTGTVK